MSDMPHEKFMVSFLPSKFKTFDGLNEYLDTLTPEDRRKVVRELNKKVFLKQESERLKGGEFLRRGS
jgi:hypothetical protein